MKNNDLIFKSGCFMAEQVLKAALTMHNIEYRKIKICKEKRKYLKVHKSLKLVLCSLEYKPLYYSRIYIGSRNAFFRKKKKLTNEEMLCMTFANDSMERVVGISNLNTSINVIMDSLKKQVISQRVAT